MVKILANLLGISILAEQTSEDSLTSHPQDLLWHTGILGTLSLTMTLMSALSLGLLVSLNARARVHVHLSSHDQTILEQLSDVLSGVGMGNLSGFIGIHPNATLSYLKDGCGKSLLELEGRHLFC